MDSQGKGKKARGREDTKEVLSPMQIILSIYGISSICIEFLDPRSWVNFMKTSNSTHKSGKSISERKILLKKDLFMLEIFGVEWEKRVRILKGLENGNIFFVCKTSDERYGHYVEYIDCKYHSIWNLWCNTYADHYAGVADRILKKNHEKQTYVASESCMRQCPAILFKSLCSFTAIPDVYITSSKAVVDKDEWDVYEIQKLVDLFEKCVDIKRTEGSNFVKLMSVAYNNSCDRYYDSEVFALENFVFSGDFDD